MRKNRGKIILILLLVAGALYELYPTYRSQQLQAELAAFGTSAKDSAARAQWMDENGDALKASGARAIKLGLDLRGGMYLTMEVDVFKFIEEQAMQKDAILEQVLSLTEKEEQTSDQPVVPLFIQNFNEIAKPKGKSLANYFYFADAANGDDAHIQASLQKGVDEAVDRAIQIIRSRIDQYGLTEPTIQKEGTRRIIIELPGVSDQASIHQLLQGTAQLEFRVLKDPEIVQKVLNRIDKRLSGDTSVARLVGDSLSSRDTTTKTAGVKDTTNAASTTKLSPADSAKHADSIAYAGLTPEQRVAKFSREHPLTAILSKGASQKSNDIYVNEHDRDAIKAILSRPDIKPLYQDELSVMFSRPIPTQSKENIYAVYFLNATPELTGKVITDARSDISPENNQPEVTMQMDQEGAQVWRRVTRENIHKQVAIILDSVVYSAPVVNGEIAGGNSQITGIGDIKEANLLRIVLKAGALPAPVKIIQESVVGPSLGADSISKGTQSIIWSMLIVLLFMGMYYITGGAVADLAVVINMLFIAAVLATFGATLTLPGMAGAVLTVGIAVDANVLIYERVREELSIGKSLKLALDDGYHRAFPPIFDGHLTAFFSGIILYAFGTGTVQGFAVTLMIGVAASLFTAIVITRVVFDILLEQKPSLIHFG